MQHGFTPPNSRFFVASLLSEGSESDKINVSMSDRMTGLTVPGSASEPLWPITYVSSASLMYGAKLPTEVCII